MNIIYLKLSISATWYEGHEDCEQIFAMDTSID
jgi:hypothetical protein